MHSTVFNVNKTLLIEQISCKYTPVGNIPIEYHELLIPYAGPQFRQDESCDILSQHISLPPYSIWLHDILAKDNLLLRSYTPLPLFTLQFMFEDSLPLPKAGLTLEERECNCFYLNPGLLHRMPMTSDKKIFSFQINIRPLDMAALVHRYPTLGCLMEGIHPNVTTRVNKRPYHIDAVCDQLIRKVMTCQYKGHNAAVFLSRCITDILLNFASQHTDAQQPFLFSSMVNADVLNNIFNFIADHPHKISSVPELAYMYNIPQDELEHGFHQHFAISIADYIHMQKMITIWHLVQAGTFSMKEVGNVTGYQDAAHIITDLKAYYGDLPNLA